ncbi:MAG: hypothetical protein EPN56_08200 [Rhodanobacter sp.]|nr:MAG: hypothetical protein EPN78_07660 [Rhodanobacter sp.]TAM11034.1 MAG: hypothetical protein EPN66_08570 [Rhodanobacter sp.]TAM35567.1 MAG: hypothetical protein EPN56_08200 [Rhodanobacter sp.]
MRRLACLVLLLAAGCGVRATELRTVTVCQLYDQRQSPPAGEVRFQARALMGPRHGAIFMDPHCPPGTAIPFRFADHLPPGSQAMKFDHALTGDVMDLSLRSFDAEVAGTYAAASAINPRGLFTVVRVAWFHKSPPKSP